MSDVESAAAQQARSLVEDAVQDAARGRWSEFNAAYAAAIGLARAEVWALVSDYPESYPPLKAAQKRVAALAKGEACDE